METAREVLFRLLISEKKTEYIDIASQSALDLSICTTRNKNVGKCSSVLMTVAFSA